MAFEYKSYHIGKVQRKTSEITEYIAKKGNRKFLIKASENAHGQNHVSREFGFVKSNPMSCFLSPVEVEANHDKTIAVYVFDDLISLKALAYMDEILLERRFDFAAQILKSLSLLHSLHISLRMINSNNILLNKRSGEVIFGDATAAVAQHKAGELLNYVIRAPEEHYPYMSPEQTGRLKKTADYRTDFYSIGISLFELFTSSLPFESKKTLELFNDHITKKFPNASDLNFGIPKKISQIISKLCAKDPEERYISAWGIESDFNTCLSYYNQGKEIPDFMLGQYDVADKLVYPEGIYGRNPEIKVLKKGFDEFCQGRKLIFILEGAEGSGKSSVVSAFRKHIEKDDHRVISGRFSRNSNQNPFSALVDAFNILIKQLLTKSAEDLELWKQSYQDSLGENSYYVTQLLPELELIVGKQKEPRLLQPQEEKRRFEISIRSFVQCLGQKGKPIVLFLNDAQWMDAASFNILKFIFHNPMHSRLFLILGYQPNSSDTFWSLVDFKESFKKINYEVKTVPLQALQKNAVAAWFIDMFKLEPFEADLFAEDVLNKTGGHPFYIKQFLEQLYDSNILSFSQKKHRWLWDADRLKEQSVTDNTAEYLIHKLSGLQKEATHLLCLAACIGEEFALDQLLIIVDDDELITKQNLLSLCEVGVIEPFVDKNIHFLLDFDDYNSNILFRFAHKKIRLTAENLLNDDEKGRIHYKIGRAQIDYLSSEQVFEQIYELANHFNLAFQLSSIYDLLLIELNLMAAQRAHSAAANSSAINYLSVAVEVINDDLWKEHHSLCMMVFKLLSVVALLENQKDWILHSIATVKEKATKKSDLIDIYEIEINFLLTHDKNLAIELGLFVLKDQLGFNLPANPSNGRILLSLSRVFLKILRSGFIPTLKTLPRVDDELFEATIRIGSTLGSAAYLTRPNFYPVLLCQAMLLGYKYGNIPRMSVTYAGFAMILSGAFNMYDTACALGEFSERLARDYDHKDQLSRVNHINWSFIFVWKHPVRDCLKGIIKAFQLGMRSGEYEYANHAINLYIFYSFFSGETLTKISDELLNYKTMIADLNQAHLRPFSESYHQGIDNLIEGSSHKIKLQGQYFDETQWRDFYRETHDYRFYFSVLKTMLTFIYKYDKEAYAWVKVCQSSQNAAVSSFAIPTFNFFEALITLRIIRQHGKKIGSRSKINKILKKLKSWMKHCPENHRHRYHIVLGDKYHTDGNFERAVKNLDLGAEIAINHGFIHEAAIAYELITELGLKQNLHSLASDYLIRSLKMYKQWGATKKVNLLLVEHEKWFSADKFSILKREESLSQYIDFDSFKSVISKLSEETKHENLLSLMVSSSVSFTGAEKAFVILRQFNGNRFQVVGSWEDGAVSTALRSLKSSENFCHAVLNYVLRSEKLIVIDDAIAANSTIPGLERDHYISEKLIRSLICMPIVVGRGHAKEFIGAIYLENNLTSHVFSDQKVQLLQLIVQTVAGRIELSKKTEILEESLLQASQVQQAMLPRTGAVSSFTISEYYASAEQTGGDWYGYYEDYNAGRLYFFIGDVTGHGVPSSLITGTASGAAYATLETLKSTGERLSIEREIEIIARSVNQAVYDTGEKVNRMMTMLFIIFDTEEGNGVYINAGHPSGIIIGKTKNSGFRTSGCPLGFLKEPHYLVHSFRLHRGESVFVYTDGLVENQGPNGKVLKMRKIRNLFSIDKSPEELKELIIRNAKAIWQNNPAEDDCAFVILRWEGNEDKTGGVFLTA